MLNWLKIIQQKKFHSCEHWTECDSVDKTNKIKGKTILIYLTKK